MNFKHANNADKATDHSRNLCPMRGDCDHLHYSKLQGDNLDKGQGVALLVSSKPTLITEGIQPLQSPVGSTEGQLSSPSNAMVYYAKR